MSQYLQFRAWLREGSPAEKRLVSLVAVVVLGLVGWALVPTGGTDTGGSLSATGGSGSAGSNLSPGAHPGGAAAPGVGSGVSATGPDTGGAGGIGTPGSAGGGQSGGNSGAPGTPGGGQPAAAGGSSPCGPLTSTDTGVTPKQITVAAILLNLAGAIGNAAVAQPPPQVQQQMAQAVVDDINSHGGVECRKLNVDFFQANPIDPTSTQNVCLQIQQAGVFAVINGFAYPQAANDCLAQAKLPVLGELGPTPDEAKQYYPYLMSIAPDAAQDFRNAIFGLRDRGWFTSGQGFKKLAILEDDCSTEINQDVHSDLVQAGVSPSQIVTNEFSCPSSGFASPSDMSNFATQDNLAGVSNLVVVTGGGSFKEFTAAAKGQGYKPIYLNSDYDGFLVTATGSTGPDPTNFDGTIATTDSKFGEFSTPGLTDPATQACIALFARHNLPSSYITGSYLGGANCNTFQLFAAAAAHDPGLTKTGLVRGLAAVGRYNEVFPNADSVYTAPGPYTPAKVAGGDFWWTIQFHASCTCWTVINPTEHPTF